ncbi:MAG: hypothetical protein AAFX76_06185 [Planctomycetota bacterium]
MNRRLDVACLDCSARCRGVLGAVVLLAGLMAVGVPPAAAATPADLLGSHVSNAGERKRDARNRAMMNLIADLGMKWVRLTGGKHQWHTHGKPSPELFDPMVRYAERRGLGVFIQLDWRQDLDGGSITDFDWEAVGRAFADHFGDRVSVYSILNEVDHAQSVEKPARVARAVGAFAQGVKSVDESLMVGTPGMGGTPMSPKKTDALLRVMGPLINRGLLDVMNLHSYQDIKKGHPSNILETSEWSPSNNFLRSKREAGVRVNVRRSAGEFNYREWSSLGATPESRGQGFFTTVWDQLNAVGDDGPDDGALVFALVYGIWSDDDGTDGKRYRGFHMATEYTWEENGKYIWKPATTGQALKNTIDNTQGMHFIHRDPYDKGVAILRGNGRKMWMWHNRTGFSRLDNPEFVEITGLPADATELKILRWDSTLAQPFKTIPLSGGQTSAVIDTRESLPFGETYLIVADSENDGGETGGLDRGRASAAEPS